MSRETEAVLKEKRSLAMGRRERAEEEIRDIDKALEVIQKSKPELRHGDFGHAEFGPRIVVGDNLEHYGSGVLKGACVTKLERPYGNIFDLLKEAGPGGVIIALSGPVADYYIEEAPYHCHALELHNKVKAALARKAL
jgi:hypothetical protein